MTSTGGGETASHSEKNIKLSLSSPLWWRFKLNWYSAEASFICIGREMVFNVESHFMASSDLLLTSVKCGNCFIFQHYYGERAAGTEASSSSMTKTIFLSPCWAVIVIIRENSHLLHFESHPRQLASPVYNIMSPSLVTKPPQRKWRF